MNSLQEILVALVGDKKRLRLKCWEPHQYVYYWNRIVIDQNGGLFDISLWLVTTAPANWEIYGEEVTFKDLEVGDRFKWFPGGDHIYVKVAIDTITSSGQFVKYRFSSYNTVLNTYVSFLDTQLVQRA
jgi:hypothetical protein